MKVWVDISGIYNWSGNFTGIQRVNYNLAKELAISKLDSGFFIYHSGNFIEVTFEDFNRHLKEINSKVAKKKIRHNFDYRKTPYYIIINLKKVVRGTVLEPFLGRAYRLARNIYRRKKGLPSHIPRKHIFSRDDIVVVIDGNWQFSGFAEEDIVEIDVNFNR